ncbi:MAG TPA: head decoration protein [Burkholderiales bacterium]|nr:head decoration protein [Burkholderiales bacterium]
MTLLSELLHAGGFIIAEQEGHLSRDNGILASGENRGAGTVLGRTVTAGTAVGAAFAGNTGTSTIGSVSVGGGAKEGIYMVELITAGATAAFTVEDPNGVNIGHGAIGTAFAGAVNFTITNVGGTSVAGDRYTVTVSQLTKKFKILAPAATDGTQIPAGILFAPVDASAADQACCVITRNAELNSNELVWPGGITAAQQSVATAQLAAAGVILR